jgi:hypothetical protein
MSGPDWEPTGTLDLTREYLITLDIGGEKTRQLLGRLQLGFRELRDLTGGPKSWEFGMSVTGRYITDGKIDRRPTAMFLPRADFSRIKQIQKAE